MYYNYEKHSDLRNFFQCALHIIVAVNWIKLDDVIYTLEDTFKYLVRVLQLLKSAPILGIVGIK